MALVTNTFLKANVPYRVGPGANDMRTFSTDELAAYVTNTRRMMREGGMAVPVLSEHAPPGTEEGGPVLLSEAQQFADAIKTAGWLKDVRFDPATGEAKAFYEITSRPYLNAIQEGSIRFTSPELREAYTDGLGRSWGQTFAHFALTPKPRNPAQTQLSGVDGTPQFAMQFSMADAVGIRPEDMPVLQFATGPSQPGARRARPLRPTKLQNMAALDSHENDNDMEESGGQVRQHLAGLTSPKVRPLGSGKPPRRMSGGGNSPYNPGVSKPNKQYTSMRRKRRRRAEGLIGQLPGVDAPLQNTRQLSEQFDYSLQDAGMGFPGPIPQQNTMQGPYGSGNAGLETALMGQSFAPPQNPDVIRQPDEAKRQKSEAITQLCGQLGIQMPADTDWTALDDGVLNAFLASLKTLIDAESRYEQDNVQQAQDMQLKEQVPMANQMSDELQFGKHDERMKKQTKSLLRDPLRKKRRGLEAREHADELNRDPQAPRRPLYPVSRPSGTRKKSRELAMSEDTDRLNRRLAATKARLDGNARHGLAQYVQNAPLPAGVKKHLMAKVGGVQFSADGQVMPTFTVQEVVKILSAAVPPQFSECDLLEAADPRAKRDQQQTRSDLARRMGDKALNEDGIQMSEGEIDAYYDKKFTDPTWAKMSVNGHNGSH